MDVIFCCFDKWIATSFHFFSSVQIEYTMSNKRVEHIRWASSCENIVLIVKDKRNPVYKLPNSVWNVAMSSKKKEKWLFQLYVARENSTRQFDSNRRSHSLFPTSTLARNFNIFRTATVCAFTSLHSMNSHYNSIICDFCNVLVHTV